MASGANGRRRRQNLIDGRGWLSIGAVAMAAVAATGLVVAAFDHASTPPATSYALPSAPPVSDGFEETSASPAPTNAAFIGDSYTAGSADDGKGWATLLSATRGWTEKNYARGGTGYVATAGISGCGVEYCPTFGEMLDEAIAAAPDVILIAGGRNDLQYPTSQVKAAVTSAIQKTRASLPNAQVMVLSPWWDDDEPPAEFSGLVEAIRAGAEAAGGTVIDAGQPLEDRADLMGPDSIHPNELGQQALADAVNTALPV